MFNHGSTSTVHGAHGPVAVFRTRIKPVVEDLIQSHVHPGNLGELPPSPRMLAWKALQVGLITSLDEAYEEVVVWRWRDVNISRSATH